MNSNAERSLKPMVGDALSLRDSLARPAERSPRRFRHPDHQQADREQKVRLEERRKERGRIAQELHDTLFQGFLGASLLLQATVEQTPADSPTKSTLNRALHLMYRGIDEGRAALQELRPPADALPSLEEALYCLWDELTPGGVQFRILVEGQAKSMNPAIQEQIYLIAREALHNALRHSGATAIEAEIEYSDRRLRVIVRDNGRGIDPKLIQSGRDLHWGLSGMRERAGSVGAQLRIWSRPGAGTEVEISVPVRNVANATAQFSRDNAGLGDHPRWQDAWPSAT
jgi:signal transduction histidine kinase